MATPRHRCNTTSRIWLRVRTVDATPCASSARATRSVAIRTVAAAPTLPPPRTRTASVLDRRSAVTVTQTVLSATAGSGPIKRSYTSAAGVPEAVRRPCETTSMPDSEMSCWVRHRARVPRSSVESVVAPARPRRVAAPSAGRSSRMQDTRSPCRWTPKGLPSTSIWSTVAPTDGAHPDAYRIAVTAQSNGVLPAVVTNGIAAVSTATTSTVRIEKPAAMAAAHSRANTSSIQTSRRSVGTRSPIPSRTLDRLRRLGATRSSGSAARCAPVISVDPSPRRLCHERAPDSAFITRSVHSTRLG